MVKDKARIKGKVTARVLEIDDIGQAMLIGLRMTNPDRTSEAYREARRGIIEAHGTPKRRTTWNPAVVWGALKGVGFRLRELSQVLRYEMAINHNIVTDEGDALIADIMATTPARAKVDGTNGHIDVGTGWTGTSPKTNTGVNTPTGSPEVMDSTYPKLKGAFGAANDNVTQYRATYEAGDLSATGINEAALLNNATRGSADCLAYGQITPSVNVGSSDTLQVDWEITFLGA